MGPDHAPFVRRETLRFRFRIRAPSKLVYRWCTDFRDDDDRLTDDLYQYRARIVLRTPQRLVRIVTVPGKDPNRRTDVEIISLDPPRGWRLEKLSFTDDETGTYRLHERDPARTDLTIVLRRTWKVRRIPARDRYRRLFERVWARYVAFMEREHARASGGAARAVGTARRNSRRRRR